VTETRNANGGPVRSGKCSHLHGTIAHIQQWQREIREDIQSSGVLDKLGAATDGLTRPELEEILKGCRHTSSMIGEMSGGQFSVSVAKERRRTGDGRVRQTEVFHFDREAYEAKAAEQERLNARPRAHDLGSLLAALAGASDGLLKQEVITLTRGLSKLPQEMLISEFRRHPSVVLSYESRPNRAGRQQQQAVFRLRDEASA
jgi:hypothetical protein